MLSLVFLGLFFEVVFHLLAKQRRSTIRANWSPPLLRNRTQSRDPVDQARVFPGRSVSPNPAWQAVCSSTDRRRKFVPRFEFARRQIGDRRELESRAVIPPCARSQSLPVGRENVARAQA